MRHEQATNLALALIDAAKPHMNVGERNYAVITVGAGDTFAAIRQLLKLVAAKHIPSQPHLLQLCRTWLDAYTLHEEYDYLRRLIEGFLMPQTIQASTAIRRLPSTPNPRPLRTVADRLHTWRIPARHRLRVDGPA
ncbi:MAG: hypothetical protein ACRDTK_03240 [Mycobacterium sp.]